MPDCVLGYMGFFRAENWSKISKKWPILPPKSRKSDLVSVYCAGTSPMTVTDYR